MKWAVLLVLVILAACSSPELVDNRPRPLPTMEPGTNVPDIPRANIPEDVPDQPQYSNPVEERPILLPLENRTPSSELQVLIGETIGDRYSYITGSMLPLLKHDPIRVTTGLLAPYDERITFRFQNSTGRVVFAKDEDSDEIGSFLVFEERRPIFEYSLRLERGSFEQLQGREIEILGAKYLIAEATNFSVTLYGVDVANNLIFTDNRTLTVNSSRQANTIARVRPNILAYELFTGSEDILLSPGESLADNIGQQKFAGNLLNILYKGAPVQEATTIQIKQAGSGYKLIADLETGVHEIPIADFENNVTLGDADELLHVAPCPGTTYCIATDDMFILTSSSGKTFVLTYSGASEDPNQLHFRDPNNNRYSYRYSGRPGVDAYADINFDRTTFRARIGPRINDTKEYNISIDQGFRNGRVEIVTKTGVIIRIGDVQGNTVPLEFVIPARREAAYVGTQSLRLNLTHANEWFIDAGNLSFVDDEVSDDTLAMTSYGTTVILHEKDRRRDANQGEDAVILIPNEKTYGVVEIKG
jgi:hypothetical protein